MINRVKIKIQGLLYKILPQQMEDHLRFAIRKHHEANLPLKESWRKSHTISVRKGVEQCADYVRQMNAVVEHIDLSQVEQYAYPMDPWVARIPMKGCQILVSMTIDYSMVLESSLAILSNLLKGHSNVHFRDVELGMIDVIRLAASKVHANLMEKADVRSRTLAFFFKVMLDRAPQSLDEALQKLLFYNALFWQANHWHNGLGRLDLVLDDYYRRDIESGKMTREQAKMMLTNFVKVLGKHTRQKSLTLYGDTGQYILLGGVDKDGRRVQNDLTEIFLEIFTELKVPDPKLILRVNEHTTDTIWKKAIDCVVTGCGSPLLMNEKLIMDGMVEFGYKKEDVWNVGTSACWEPLIIGKSFDQNNPFPNIPVVAALNDAINASADYKDISSVIAATKVNIAKQIKETIHDITFDVSPLYSLFFDSCIERGKDYSQGGADYAYHGVQVVGLPNLVNALLNLKKYVFEQNALTLEECRKAISANYEGHEDVRQLLLSNELKFGNSNPEVVALTNDIMDFISKEVEKYTCNGEKLKVGFSSSQYIMARKKAKASLDGRKDYDPFAVHISPVSQKIDIQEVLDFAGLLDYSGNRMNGNVVDFILPSAYIKQKDKLVTILRNAMTSGVYELQLNVLDAATLRDAKAHPEKYPDLVVRVWGFSAYFNDLPEEYKDNLIARAEAYE